MKKVYLASPFFNKKERNSVTLIADFLRKSKGLDVYVPMEHTIPNAWDLPNNVWGKAVFDEDVKAIDECDTIIVLNWGMYSDSGTAWECGYAFAKGKDVVNLLMPSKDNDYSLMMVNGCKKTLPWFSFVREEEWNNFSAINQKQGLTTTPPYVIINVSKEKR